MGPRYAAKRVRAAYNSSSLISSHFPAKYTLNPPKNIICPVRGGDYTDKVLLERVGDGGKVKFLRGGVFYCANLRVCVIFYLYDSGGVEEARSQRRSEKKVLVHKILSVYHGTEKAVDFKYCRGAWGSRGRSILLFSSRARGRWCGSKSHANT